MSPPTVKFVVQNPQNGYAIILHKVYQNGWKNQEIRILQTFKKRQIGKRVNWGAHVKTHGFSFWGSLIFFQHV
jgi:hypothetical protein